MSVTGVARCRLYREAERNATPQRATAQPQRNGNATAQHEEHDVNRQPKQLMATASSSPATDLLQVL